MRFFSMQINKKAFCFLGLTLALFLTSQAQRPRFQPQVHELGIQLGSIQTPFETNSNHTTWANGLRYSYHIDKSKALRFGAFFRNNQYNYTPSISERYQPFFAKQQSFELRAGYMLKHHIYRLQLYAAVDAIGRYAKIDETFDQDLTGAPNKNKVWGVGGALVVGAQMFANKHVSLGVETDLYAIFQNRRENDPTIAILPHEGLFIDGENGWNMVSVYIAFHFKRMRKSCTCGKPGS
ncbi:MAG: outer membrane beta-barrel protein [Bacteroidia bacterium]